MACRRTQLLAFLLKLKRLMKCDQDKSIIDVYIARLEEIVSEEIDLELWR
ncbi:MAG: hypothetical protein F7C38_06830 [Desulfurococcales archaeon]|nr:hypothetical protein [Desulfurococcales archaeon]